jgi:hypothetical protein
MTEPQKRPDMSNFPPFAFYPEFGGDWERFPGTVKKVVGDFLGLLQETYSDRDFQKKWEQHGEYWGAYLPEIEYRVIWLVVYPSHLGVPITSQPAKEIQVIAIEPLPGHPRKRGLV